VANARVGVGRSPVVGTVFGIPKTVFREICDAHTRVGVVVVVVVVWCERVKI
jgi:hypothetical protein